MDFLTLYDQNYHRVKKFILTITMDEWAADDLLQETFIRVRKSRETVREPAKVSSWIFRIAYHLCMDHMKKNKRLTGSTAKKDLPFIKDQILSRIEQKQMSSCIRQKMERLSESKRIIIDLYDIMGFSHKEIADILSITEDNSKVKLHRARKELRKILRRECTLSYDKRNILICEPHEPAGQKISKNVVRP